MNKQKIDLCIPPFSMRWNHFFAHSDGIIFITVVSYKHNSICRCCIRLQKLTNWPSPNELIEFIPPIGDCRTEWSQQKNQTKNRLIFQFAMECEPSSHAYGWHLRLKEMKASQFSPSLSALGFHSNHKFNDSI